MKIRTIFIQMRLVKRSKKKLIQKTEELKELKKTTRKITSKGGSFFKFLRLLMEARLLLKKSLLTSLAKIH